MSTNDPQDKIRELEEEVHRLKGEIYNHKKSIRDWIKWFVKGFISSAVGWFIGKSLKNDTVALVNEIPNLKQETVANFFGSLVNRIFYIGVIGLLIALQPIIQTYILYQQNKKLDIQNEKIQTQVYLEEATRRNNLVLLMDNILEKVNQELTDPNNTKDTLSDPLIGRIQALAQGFQPYQFLDGDSLTKPLSPERGQFLLALVNSGIDTITLKKIYEQASFEKAFLQEVVWKNSYLKQAILNGANLERAKFFNINLEMANLNGANLSEVNFRKVNLKDATLIHTKLEKAYLGGGNLIGTFLTGADLTEADFSGAIINRASLNSANLTKTNFREADLTGANLGNSILKETNLSNSKLNGIILEDSTFLTKIKNWEVVGYNEIIRKYKLTGPHTDAADKKYYQLELKSPQDQPNNPEEE